MDLAEATRLLKHIASSIASHVTEFEWYLFGSCLGPKAFPNDLDLLILYRTDEDARYLRSYFRSTVIPFPVDLLLLTSEEEVEFNFIETQSARRIYPAQDPSAPIR